MVARMCLSVTLQCIACIVSQNCSLYVTKLGPFLQFPLPARAENNNEFNKSFKLACGPHQFSFNHCEQHIPAPLSCKQKNGPWNWKWHTNSSLARNAQMSYFTSVLQLPYQTTVYWSLFTFITCCVSIRDSLETRGRTWRLFDNGSKLNRWY
jgi:hypothetical protein